MALRDHVRLTNDNKIIASSGNLMVVNIPPRTDSLAGYSVLVFISQVLNVLLIEKYIAFQKKGPRCIRTQPLSLVATHRFSPPSHTFCPSTSPLPHLKSSTISLARLLGRVVHIVPDTPESPSDSLLDRFGMEVVPPISLFNFTLSSLRLSVNFLYPYFSVVSTFDPRPTDR
jgi:hypothetical protein